MKLTDEHRALLQSIAAQAVEIQDKGEICSRGETAAELAGALRCMDDVLGDLLAAEDPSDGQVPD